MVKEAKKLISVITPCFNEEGNVRICYEEVKSVFENNLPNYEFEHIFVDNDSTDQTVDILRKIASEDKRVKVIVNSRNIGPFRSMWKGLQNISGVMVIPLVPADLQDPPEVIPKMVEKFENGYSVVYGYRAQRMESWRLRLMRSVYYRLVRKLSGTEIPINAGEFLLADKRIIDSILELDDEYPYIRGLVAQTGAKSTGIEYVWRKRNQGSSKNNLISLVDQGINGLVSTTRLPARLIILLGFFLSILAILSATVMLSLFLLNPTRPALGIPTLIVSSLFLSGIQLLFLGVIGEYVLSVHSQVRKRPKSFDVERINL